MAPEKASLPQIISIPLSKIRPNPNNPRKVVTPEAVDKCAASLKAVGQKTPIKVRPLPDGNYELIGGHIRLEAAKKLGWETLDGIVRDILPDQAFLESILDNRDEEMTWLEWYEAIEAFMAQNTGMTQQKAADELGISQQAVSRAVRLMKVLNNRARQSIYQLLVKTPETVEITEKSIYRLGDLADGKAEGGEPSRTIEKALWVVLDRKMTEPEVNRFVAWIKKGNYPSEYPITGTRPKSAESKLPPSDPNYGLLKDIPEWTSVIRNKEGGYRLSGDLDKFGAPYGIYCLLSGMMKYFQRVEQARNPEAVPDNPYEAKLEQLLEKGVRAALENSAQEQKEYEAKKSRKGKKPSKVSSRQSAFEEIRTKEDKNAPTLEKREGGPAEPASGEPVEPVTEGELKTITDLLGNPELKDNLKKMFKDLF